MCNVVSHILLTLNTASSNAMFCWNCFEPCLVLHGDGKAQDTGGFRKISRSNMLVTWNLRQFGNWHQPTVQVTWRLQQATFSKLRMCLYSSPTRFGLQTWRGVALNPQVSRRCSLSLVEHFCHFLFQKSSKTRQRNWFFPTSQVRVPRF